MTYTITLTQHEMDMLINATNIMHIRYKRPEMYESAHKGAQKYADLCSKLYYKMMDQLMDAESVECKEDRP